MQALYDKAWDSLLKLSSSHPKTQAKREAVASHIMTLKLSPKIVDEITQNLRAKIDTVRQTEKSIMRICRSEEHTSELQSLMRISYAVFCLKKKTNKKAVST